MTNHFLSVFISHCIRKKGILKPRELAMDSSNLNLNTPVSIHGIGSNDHSTSMIVD